MLHLMPLAAWRAHSGAWIRPGSLATEGFIHCTSDEATLTAVANHFYRGHPGDFVVLVIDPEAVSAEIRYEAAAPAPPPGVASDVLFPHVYGPIENSAVVSAMYARRDLTGEFVGFEARPPLDETHHLADRAADSEME
ncbi:DUF952 domain-containing protein [Hoyosella subflava]|uniref:DUF952 domain-containing protein n=1 Tax=Hoyosella subflava (strain DSM 45089 / JCM 17490 / NBRC 109087 / DQS3-9A1) TaxID=443218 RepID=F6EK33_HOYSD|nr:DUF952 domain-containing protein [Hoyosella subflava]AEF41391.1 hypothetical protein AS9A_2944 [Hoyosella subflava DQS3-9A1]